MPPRKKKKVATPDASVVALTTSVGETLLIRSNPSDADVRSFVAEMTRRLLAGEPGGPSGIPPFHIYAATRYPDEASALATDGALGEVDVTDLIPT